MTNTFGDRPGTRDLKQWWIHGAGAAQIAWGTDGDFERCVKLAGKYMGPNEAHGFCANRHKEATGARPGHAAGEQHRH